MGFPNRIGTVAVVAWTSMRTISAYREKILIHRGAFNAEVPIVVDAIGVGPPVQLNVPINQNVKVNLRVIEIT
jgi:hypothetical protein